MARFFRLLPVIIALIILVGCSIPEFYLDIRYPSAVVINEQLPIDVFITNSRIGTTVRVESIQLSGEIVQNSQLIPGRNGLYTKREGSDRIIAEPNRRMIQFETGTFSLALRPINKGVFNGNFTFFVNGEQISREITVEVK
jgi:hypothetical protein